MVHDAVYSDVFILILQQQQQQQQNSQSNDRYSDLDQGNDVAVPRRDNEDIHLTDLCGCSGGMFCPPCSVTSC